MGTASLGWQVFILALLMAGYAFLTAAETAARSLVSNKMKRSPDAKESEGEKLLATSEKLSDHPSGLRVGLIFISLLAAALAYAAFGGRLQGILVQLGLPRGLGAALALLLVVLLFSFFLLLLCVMLPRRLASRNPEKTARRLFGPATLVSALFAPMARALSSISEVLLKAAGVSPDLGVEQVTEDEIRMLVDVGEEKGAIQENERQMIENVFEFNNMTAAECMTHRTDMYAIWLADSTEEIIQMIRDTGLSRFPVYEEDLDHIIGTVTTRDFLMNQQQQEPLPLRDILRQARFVPESVRTDVLFRDMQRNKFHMAIVVDEYGGTSGLITMEDLLEEIVGNIYDEFDPQVQQDITPLGENRWRVAGSADIEAFNEETASQVPVVDEYDTVGGFILSQMDTIPDDGTQPEIDGFGLHFKVESVADHRIEWVEVSKTDA